MGMKTLAMMAFAVALGAAGCRNQNRGEVPGPAGGDTTMGGAEAEPQAGTEKKMVKYTIGRIDLENNNVHLQAQEAGELEAQAGRELVLTKAEFERMAGSEAKEGTVVRVTLGKDGKAEKIEYLIREDVPEKGTEPAPQ